MKKKGKAKKSRSTTPSGLLHWLEPSRFAACAIVATVGFLIYVNSLPGQFVFDDTVIVQGNSAIQGFDWAHIEAIFSSHYWKGVETQGGLYRPVVMLTYAFNYVLGGEDPWGYHLLNILVHMLNAILVFFVLDDLFHLRRLSFLSALFFVLHPIRTEGVSSIVGRAEGLSTMFMLLAWWAYIRNRKTAEWGWLFASVGLFVLATLSKESAFCFIALIPVTDLFLEHGPLKGRFMRREVLGRYLAFAIAAAGVLMLRVSVLGAVTPLYINPDSNPLIRAGAWPRFLTATHVFARYLLLLLFPLNLSADYSYNQIPIVAGILSWRAVLPLLVLAFSLGGTIASARRHPILFFSGLIFFSSFVLTSNWIRPMGTIMGERLMYFPALGFNCALAFLILKGMQDVRLREWAFAFLVLVVGGYAARTVSRNEDWRSHYTLFRSAAETSPDSSLVQSNYAVVLLNDRNDPNGAIEHAGKAAEILPRDPTAFFTLGQAYQKIGDLPRAADAFESVVRLAPRTSGGVAALKELARIHKFRGDLKRAEADHQQLLEWRK